MVEIKALVLRTAGTNCDEESVFAFQLAGAKVSLLHINELRQNSKKLLDYQILCIPGGFSYGDDIFAGKVLAMEMSLFLREVISEFLDKGGLVLGICNGFQVLVNMGLLPAVKGRFVVEAALVDNEAGLFIDKWVELSVERRDIPWTQMIDKDRLFMPIAHAEGRFIVNEEIMDEIRQRDLVVFRYLQDNPNGSVDNIAGICDPSGQVLGMMPHPERAVMFCQYPDWAGDKEFSKQMPPLDIFRSAVSWVGRI